MPVNRRQITRIGEMRVDVNDPKLLKIRAAAQKTPGVTAMFQNDWAQVMSEQGMVKARASFREAIDMVADKVDLSPSEVEAVVHAFFDEIGNSIANRGPMMIPNFGVFAALPYLSRYLKSTDYPSYAWPAFRAAGRLRAFIRKYAKVSGTSSLVFRRCAHSGRNGYKDKIATAPFITKDPKGAHVRVAV